MMNKKFIRKTLSILLSVLIFSAFLMPIASVQGNTASASAPEWRDPPNVTPFQDVPYGAWFHRGESRYVSWAWVNGITEGTSTTRFNPNVAITRAEFATLLYRVAGRPGVSGLNALAFRDNDAIRQRGWAVDAIRWASHGGNNIVRVTTGFGDNTYQPGTNIRREEIATMLFRHAQNTGGGINLTAPVNNLNGFHDGRLVSSWAQVAMRWAVNSGIIQGNPQNRLLPQGYATRAETVTMLSRFAGLDGVPVPGNLPAVPFIDFGQTANHGRTVDVSRTIRLDNDNGVTVNVAGADPHPAKVISGPVAGGSPGAMVSKSFIPEVSGMYRFEMFAASGTVEMIISGPGITEEQRDMIRGGIWNINLVEGVAYSIVIRHKAGQPIASATASVRIWPPIVLNPTGTRIANVNDRFQFQGQQNSYTLNVPSGGGTYRFEIHSLTFDWDSPDSSITLEILRGNSVIQNGTQRLYNGQGLTLDLNQGLYTIRVTPTTGPLDNMRYTLRIWYPDDMRSFRGNPRDATRGNVLVNHSFGFIGQQNRYHFTPKETGAHTLTFAYLPANCQVYVEVRGHGLSFNNQFILLQGRSINLQAGLQYEIRIRHMTGGIGHYGFVVANP